VAEVPLDAASWSAGERLLLLQAIEHFGPHAWGSIAKAVRSAASRMTEHTRPAGFFSTAVSQIIGWIFFLSPLLKILLL
jgi:hypothetical protein